MEDKSKYLHTQERERESEKIRKKEKRRRENENSCAFQMPVMWYTQGGEGGRSHQEIRNQCGIQMNDFSLRTSSTFF